MENDKLLTVIGISRTLRLPTKWIKDEAIAGRLPCLQVGKRLFFNRNAVEASLLARASGREAAQPPTQPRAILMERPCRWLLRVPSSLLTDDAKLTWLALATRIADDEEVLLDPLRLHLYTMLPAKRVEAAISSLAALQLITVRPEPTGERWFRMHVPPALESMEPEFQTIVGNDPASQTKRAAIVKSAVEKWQSQLASERKAQTK
jgi:hypothetical protein